MTSLAPFHMTFVIIYVTIPFLLSQFWHKGPVFVNEYEKNIYLCHLFPNFAIGMLNFSIYNLANQLMYNKMLYAETIHTMLDNQERPNYTLNQEMPVIQPYLMENIGTIINLSLVLTKVNENSYYKSIIFISAITIIYALNFGWICLYVLFFAKPLSAAGSEYFLAHAFYDFTIFFGYFIVILTYGAQANNVDFEIKDLFTKI